MEIRVTLSESGNHGPEHLAEWLGDRAHGTVADEDAWRVELGPDGDEVVIELGGDDAVDELLQAVRSWVEDQDTPVRATLHGLDSPLVIGRGIAFGNISGSTYAIGDRTNLNSATPPGPVNDPDDDWPRD
ncbi:hypothetical protein [Streptomyces cavernicola]|uniref:Uncharacterized protein n=1 Tax=Streptomyces cavernicola TaxID=3043613 RepID=A0ABT6SLJ2_9ACTN|nr:hypothetical protein [Streptomyces sp. B-S-A6]MDI3409066.1 hypothetical protein [Streptomyces sp. B-S-A6]